MESTNSEKTFQKILIGDMASATYTHDSEDITIEDCTNGSSNTQTFKFPQGTWKKKLDKINKKIKKFKINKNIKWIMSINEQKIDPSDITQFQQVLSLIPPPINIKITYRLSTSRRKPY